MASTPDTSFCRDDRFYQPTVSRPSASATSLPSPSHTACDSEPEIPRSSASGRLRPFAAIKQDSSSPDTDSRHLYAPPASPNGPDTSDRSSLEPDSDADSLADELALDEACATIWQSFCGLETKHYPTFHFTCGQRTYERLHEKLARKPGLLEHFEDTRKDWNAATGNLTLRLMPTRIHEIFQDKFGWSVKQELDRIARDYPSLRSLCRKITPSGHSKVITPTRSLRTPKLEKSPDGQWQFLGVA